MTAHRHAATHSATAQHAILCSETAGDGIADSQVGGAETGLKSGIADTSREGGGSGIPYPTLDQVERSLAIQRLQWLQHLPARRTPAEHGIYQRIRAAGWTAPA